MNIVQSMVRYAPAVVLPRIATMVMLVVLTRLMVPQEFGRYVLVITTGEILDMVCANWVRVSLARFGAGDPAGLAAERTRCAGLYAVSIGIGMVLTVPAAFALEANEPLVFAIAVLAYIGSAALVRFSGTLMVVRDDRWGFAGQEVLRAVAGLAVGLVLAREHGGYFIVSAGTSMVTGLIGVWGLARSWRGIEGAAATTTPLPDLLRYGLPMIPVAMISMVLTSSDRFLLGILSGPSSVALYAAAVVLARQPLEFIFGVMNTRIFAHLAALHDQQGTKAASQALTELIGGVALVIVPSAVGLVLVRDVMARVLLPADYAEVAGEIIPLVVAAALASGIKSFVYDQIFHMLRRTTANALTSIPALVIGFGAMYGLITAFGILGCAIAYALQFGVLLVSTVVVTHRWMPVSLPWSDLARIGAAGAIMAVLVSATLSFLSTVSALLALVAAVAVGAVSYAAAVWVLRPTPIRNLLPAAAPTAPGA
jgi:O-antigen/teichoic acid export membrane protein